MYIIMAYTPPLILFMHLTMAYTPPLILFMHLIMAYTRPLILYMHLIMAYTPPLILCVCISLWLKKYNWTISVASFPHILSLFTYLPDYLFVFLPVLSVIRQIYIHTIIYKIKDVLCHVNISDNRLWNCVIDQNWPPKTNELLDRSTNH